MPRPEGQCLLGSGSAVLGCVRRRPYLTNFQKPVVKVQPNPAARWPPLAEGSRGRPTRASMRPVIGELELEDLRRAIDEVDQEILLLIARRVRIVCDVADYKRERGIAVYDPDRERHMLQKLAENRVAPLEADTVKRVFERLIDECRRIEQRQISVADHKATE